MLATFQLYPCVFKEMSLLEYNTIPQTKTMSPAALVVLAIRVDEKLSQHMKQSCMHNSRTRPAMQPRSSNGAATSRLLHYWELLHKRTPNNAVYVTQDFTGFNREYRLVAKAAIKSKCISKAVRKTCCSIFPHMVSPSILRAQSLCLLRWLPIDKG